MMRIKCRSWYHSDEFGLLVEPAPYGPGFAHTLHGNQWKKIIRAVREAQVYKYQGARPTAYSLAHNFQVQLEPPCGEWRHAHIFENKLVWS